MKKIVIAFLSIITAVALVGCGDQKASSNNTTDNKSNNEVKTESKASKPEKQGPTQEDLNEKLKKEAVKADFVKLNGHSKENKDLKVFAEGKISNVDYEKVTDLFPSFTLTQKEEKGYGMYHITNILDIKGLKDGDTVKIYGTVDENANTGLVKINSTVIEVEK